MRKKLPPIIMFCVLLAGSAFFASASPQSTAKDEMIYCNLHYDGSVGGIFVVNGFTMATAGQIIDYGNYTDIKNLTSTDNILTNQDQLTVKAQQGRFYYQGRLQEKELPWKIGITYQINGSEIQANQLADKSGALKVLIRTQKNPHTDPYFFEHYALQISVTLDSAKCSNIEATNATIASVGNHKVLNFTVLPGTEKILEIRADVRDFSMPGIQINAVELRIDMGGTDMQEIGQNLLLLRTGIVEVDKAAKEIHAGTEKINSGMASSVQGSQELLAGSRDLHAGSLQFYSAVDSFADGASALQSGLAALHDGLQQLTAENEHINYGAEQMFAMLLQSANEQLLGQAQRFAMLGITLQPLTKSNYAGQLNSIIAALEAVSSAQDDIIRLTSLQRGLAACDEFTIGLLRYTTGVENAAEGAGSLSAGIQQQDVQQSAAQIAGSAKILSDSTGRLSVGLGELTEGNRQLQKAMQKLHAGTGQLFEGTTALSAKTRDLETGSLSVTNMLPKSAEIKRSFVSEKNTKVETLQFMMKTPDIQTQNAEQPAEPKKEKSSFWQRLMKLFRR